MDPKSEMSSQSILSASRICLNLFEKCWLRQPDAIVELEAAERRFRAWTNKLNVFSDSANLDEQLRAAKREKIRELTMLLLSVLNDNLLLALKLISSGRKVTSDIEHLKVPLFCITESLKRLENFAAVTIHATHGSLIKRTIVFAEKQEYFQELSRMFSIAILSRYSVLVPNTRLGASPAEVSEDIVPSKEKILAPLPEGLFLALLKSSIVRHFKILYERDQRDRGIRREAPVMQMPTHEACDPAEECMNDSPTTSEAGVALCHKAPNIPDGQKTGTCPICKRTLPAEEFKSPNWIVHVIKDIQPYVCLSRECMSGLQFFERRQDWINHMHNIHTTSWIRYLHNTYVWKCSICKLTSLTDFVSKQGLEESFFAHLQEFHPKVEQSMRSHLLACGTVRQPRSSESCPICGTRHLAQGIPHGEDKTRATENASHTREVNDHGVENCIADHLRALAFSFIGRLMDDGQQDANIPSSGASNNDRPELDDLPEIGPDDQCPMLPLEESDEIDSLPIPDKEKLDMQSCIAQNLQALQVRSDEQTQWNFDWVDGCRVVEPNISDEERERLFPTNQEPGNDDIWSGTDPKCVPASMAYIACLFIIVELCNKVLSSSKLENNDDDLVAQGCRNHAEAFTNFGQAIFARLDSQAEAQTSRFVSTFEQAAHDLEGVQAQLLSTSAMSDTAIQCTTRTLFEIKRRLYFHLALANASDSIRNVPKVDWTTEFVTSLDSPRRYALEDMISAIRGGHLEFQAVAAYIDPLVGCPGTEETFDPVPHLANFKPDSWKLMRWICFAVRPLSLVELREAMLIDTDSLNWSINNLEHTQKQRPTRDAMRGLVSSLSCGLANVSDGDIVRFINSSVRESLIARLPAAEVCARRTKVGIAHHELAKACLLYLDMNEIDQSLHDYSIHLPRTLLEKFPFLLYAMTSLWTHIKQSDDQDVSQVNLVKYSTGPMKRWRQLNLILTLSPLRYLPQGTTRLHILSLYGVTGVTRALLKTFQVDVDHKDSEHRTPLSLAAMGGHDGVVRLLVERGADIEGALIEDSFLRRKLASMDVPNFMRFPRVLDTESYTDTGEGGRTPLSWAAASGHQSVVNFLLDVGANIEAQDLHGCSPLLMAVANRHKGVIRFLLKSGAKIETQDCKGRLPLSYAAWGGCVDVVRLLLESGAKPEKQDLYGWSPLTIAARHGHDHIVRLLVESGVRKDVPDTQGRTPLIHAVERRREGVVRILLEAGAITETQDSDGCSPLLLAARYGHDYIVRLLIKSGAGKDVPDKQGQTPLSHAVERRREDVVRILLEAGAITETQDSDGCSPLSIAATYGYYAIVSLLIKSGAGKDVPDKQGQTPLFWAARNGHESIVCLLLQSGASITRDLHGASPLSIAASHGHYHTVRWLLEFGAEKDIQDEEWMQSLRLTAASNGYHRIAMLLSRYSATSSTK